MAAVSKVRMLLDGVYGQRFLIRIGSPAALVSSRKLSVWAEYDKKKKKKEEEEAEADKVMRRSVLQMNLDVLGFASDAKSDKRKTSGDTGRKAAAADASAGEADRDS
ncbi:uncharacterized protein LOC122045621 [Zingiber officinale]|uniref:uncharacterized protein LOC122045621 n=1 Tax=Zingiber officinale TaxID=94328 RepID=UPI001C4B0B8D|nr:uncharacterized protein LOC122045621 [Zingiber officinale]